MRLSLRGGAVLAAMALFSAGALPAASAQTVDELLAKHFESRGGLDKLKALNTVKMVGTVSGRGSEGTMTAWTKRPNLMRQEMGAEGQQVIQAFDGVRAWTVNPMMGMMAPTELPAALADQIRTASDFDGVLVDYKAKGHTIEIVGPDTVEGAKVVKLKVTTKAGLSQYVSLDATTGLERKISAEIEQGDRKMTVETFMSDYRPVSGIVVPFSVRRYVNGQLAAEIAFRTIEFNVPIDDSVFRMPGKQPHFFGKSASVARRPMNPTGSPLVMGGVPTT